MATGHRSAIVLVAESSGNTLVLGLGVSLFDYDMALLNARMSSGIGDLDARQCELRVTPGWERREDGTHAQPATVEFLPIP